MRAYVEFGKAYVSIGFTPDGWTGNGLHFYGNGRTTWDVAYAYGPDDELIVVYEAKRQQVNTILKNMSLKGRMAAA